MVFCLLLFSRFILCPSIHKIPVDNLVFAAFQRLIFTKALVVTKHLANIAAMAIKLACQQQAPNQAALIYYFIQFINPWPIPHKLNNPNQIP